MMHFGDDTTVHDLARENETLRAEIERLREQVASLQASAGYEASIAQVKVERLTDGFHEIIRWAEVIAAIARRALEGK